MKRSLLCGSILSTVFAVSVTAQTGSSGSSSHGGSRERRQVTVTGCLGTDASAGAAGTTGAAASGTTSAGATGSRSAGSNFVLTNAKIGGAMTRVKLEGGDQSDLQKYLNSQVEIRGTMTGAEPSGAGSTSGSTISGATITGTGTAGSTGAGTAAIGESAGPTLRVNSVRQVTSSCSRS